MITPEIMTLIGGSIVGLVGVVILFDARRRPLREVTCFQIDRMERISPADDIFYTVEDVSLISTYNQFVAHYNESSEWDAFKVKSQ